MPPTADQTGTLGGEELRRPSSSATCRLPGLPSRARRTRSRPRTTSSPRARRAWGRRSRSRATARTRSSSKGQADRRARVRRGRRHRRGAPAPNGEDAPGLRRRASTASINLTLLPPGEEPPTGGAPPPTGSERVTAEKQREAGSRFAAFFIAIAVVMLVARLFGMAAVDARPAARDGRGDRRHLRSARRCSARSLRSVSTALFPIGHHPVHRGGRPARADLLHVPGRPRGRPEPAQGADRAGRGDLERERRAADDARARGRAADLRAGRARTRSSWPSRCSWASRCRSPPSRSSRGSWSSGGCSSARSARWPWRARRSTT